MTQQERITLITGANKGIGLEVARQLGKAGHRVLLGARDAGRAQAAADRLRGEGVDARIVAIDLDDPASVAAAVADVERHEGRLDVLVNNAAVVDPADGPAGTADPAAVRRIFDTNFFGSIAVTQGFLPLLRKSAAGRIINVSSGLGSIALNADPKWEYAAVKLLGYNGSKAALNLFTVLLAAELEGEGIRVHAVNPGYTATDLNGNSGHQTVAEGAQEIVRLARLDGGPTGTFTNKDGPDPW
ncbi:SDR family oxidoreductase [Luteibacter flocculans]|uniref:SDR family oxidoreductase n=1 Tax=Luteibacter flocculans TaxID=2780091 RepID=A0ABY4TAJ0_9GAMM|nr:SDR family oxidoreductase [Luteibacter flocculans]URL59731.1 SDR family oxidoreductase [Luteibacter flocculans]